MTAAEVRVPTRTTSLPTGGEMPLLGLGTWQLRGREAIDATAASLELGYRLLDTATVYRNESEVGKGIQRAKTPRDAIFLTTKLPPDRAGQEVETLRASLSMLDTDYVDLWLIHWPPPSGVGADLWSALGKAQELGLARDIGVSNYSLAQLDELVEATGVTPAVNQVEWSPLLFDREVLEGHRQRGVVLEGYSALKGGTLEHPVVTDVATRHGRTPAQVIIRWHLQHDVVVIPKSSRPERIAANADVDGFTLTADDMAALDSIAG